MKPTTCCLWTATFQVRHLFPFGKITLKTIKISELLIDGLGRASPLEEPEACIYGYGAVRFLANATISTPKDATPNSGAGGRQKQKSISQRLARHGAVQLMVLHLQMLNEAVGKEIPLIKNL